jgi:hypothetical protein
MAAARTYRRRRDYSAAANVRVLSQYGRAMKSEPSVRTGDSGLIRYLEERWRALAATTGDVATAAERMTALRADEQRLRAEGRWIAGPTSLLEVLRLEFDEVRNCRIVRWLLDPLSPHGFGVASLRQVLARVNELASQQHLPTQEYGGVENATVRLEEVRGTTRADIVIATPAWQVVIEAKINAAEQHEQGRRLSEMWPGATYVYLTKRGDPMKTAGEEPWILMRWAHLIEAVQGVADAALPKDGPNADVLRARRAVNDYLYAARRLTS